MIDFFKRLFGYQTETSGATAKERLRLVLLSDHLSLAPETIEAMKRDLLEVISRYVEIDEKQADVKFEHRDREIAMLASVPVRSVRLRPLPPPSKPPSRLSLVVPPAAPAPAAEPPAEPAPALGTAPAGSREPAPDAQPGEPVLAAASPDPQEAQPEAEPGAEPVALAVPRAATSSARRRRRRKKAQSGGQPLQMSAARY